MGDKDHNDQEKKGRLTEEQRRMCEALHRNLDGFSEEIKKEIEELMNRMRPTLDAWNNLKQEAQRKYNITEDELYKILSQAQETKTVEWNDFISLSLSEEEALQAGGLLDTVIKRSREEGRPISEIIQEAKDVLEGNAGPLFPVPFNSAVSAIAYATKKNTEEAGDWLINEGEKYRILINNSDKNVVLGPGPDKLLKTALIQFARQNHLDRNRPEIRTIDIEIPLKEYAAMLGKDVTEHETNTPEEAAAEKARVKAVLDNTRKKVKEAGQVLYSTSLDWTDKKGPAFTQQRLLSGFTYTRGSFILSFNPRIALALAHSAISQYDLSMLAIDDRRPNAYRIMEKITEHFNMISNQRKQTHNRLSVETLLAATDLPTYETVPRGHWEDRIKEPLEKNLDYLHEFGLLADWKYTHEKGKQLTDEEAASITKYADFIKLYIEFVPAHQKDQTERIEKKRAEEKKLENEIRKLKAKEELKKEQ